MVSIPHDSPTQVSIEDEFPPDVEYITSRLRYLDAFNTEIEQLEARAKALKEYVNEKAFEFIRDAPTDDEQKELASEVYWTRMFVKSGTVCEALDIYPQQIKNHLYAGVVECACRKCGNPTPVTLTSRTGLQELRSRSYQYVKCDECKKIEAQESAARADEYAKAEAQRLAYVNELRSMPYAEYLKTDHWQETRRRALKRAKFTCQLCNASGKPLHVHHRTYEHRGYEYAADLIVLCADCHQTFHENGTLS